MGAARTRRAGPHISRLLAKLRQHYPQAREWKAERTTWIVHE